MCPRDLAPDHTDLASSNLLLGAVDVCDALAQVEGCVLGVLDTLNLDERGVGVGVALAALVRKVLAPAVKKKSPPLANDVLQSSHRRSGMFGAFGCGFLRAFVVGGFGGFNVLNV